MSEVVAVLLLVAIVVSMGVIVLAAAGGGLSGLGGSFGGLVGSQGNAVAENFAVEQAAFTFPGSSSSASPILDGTSTAQTAGASTSIGSTLTTARANDVVVVDVSAADLGTATPPAVTGLSGGGLTWTHRTTASAVSYSQFFYVPITITNSQTTATPDPFQQMLTLDPATYSTYEATNLGNVRFCLDMMCSSPLYAWLESCSSACTTAGSTSTSATVWVELTQAIAASGGTLTIYMVFEPTSTNFDGVYWGEAPQLSPIYAQYDNGAGVFTAYFNGDTATSSFSVYAGYALAQATGVTGPGGATINAIEATGYNANNPVFVFDTAMSNAGLVAESSFYSPGCVTPGTDTGAAGFVDSPTTTGVANAIEADCGYATVYFDQDYMVGGAVTRDVNPQGTPTAAWLYGTVTYSGPSATSWTAFIAPQLYSSTGGYTGTVTNNPLSAVTSLYLGELGGTSATYTLTVYYNFMRARAYPPSGVMPTAVFGSITGGSTSSYLPIVLTNSQTSATPGTFQQMVAWDPATYSSYEATNLGNIRFCADAACVTHLYAWLESCSSACTTAGSTSTSAVLWVELNTAIASGGTLTIYMVFEPTSTNFDANYWGEAPQLSSTYAQYDNGANVFTDYWNFAGTACPTGWTCSGTTINNGISAASAASYAYSTATYGLTANELDFYGTFAAATSTYNAGFGYNHDTPNGNTVEWTINDNTGPAYGCGSTNACLQTSVAGPTYNYLSTLTATGAKVYSIYWGSTASATACYSYTTCGTSTSGIPTAAISLGIYNAQGTQATIGPFNWLRLRVYPPSGVMPTASFGSVTGSGFLYVPVTITNSQATATPVPFQQMLTLDPAAYATYEATNLGNIRFCADTLCSTPLYAWLESCSSACTTAGSTSTSAVLWVELNTAIASGGTLTIYMVFEPTSTNYDGVYWGEAPQLSPIYAQYDNGANVFTDYWNFAGTACPTGWTCSGTTINNGISAASDTNFAYTTATFGLTANILDFYGDFPAATSAFNAGFGYNHDTSNQPTVEWDINDNTPNTSGCTSANVCLQTASGAAAFYLSTLTTTGTQVYSIYWGSTASATACYSYTNCGTSTTDIPTSPISLGIYNDQGTQATIGPFNWLRIRAYPPSGVMPTASLGSAGSTASTFDVEEWSAVASSALSSATITATFSASDTSASWIAVFGVSGANTASPFDPCAGCAGGAAPQTASGASNVQTTMSTSNSNDLLLYACSAGAGGMAAGFTSIYSDTFAPDQNEYVGYETVSSAQTNAVTSCGGAYTYGAEITDAVAGTSTSSYYGATLYVRNVGTVPVTLVSIYVVDQSTNTFVVQVPIDQTLAVGAVVSIPQTTLTFTPSHGHTYSFKVTSSLGNGVTLNEEAN